VVLVIELELPLAIDVGIEEDAVAIVDVNVIVPAFVDDPGEVTDAVLDPIEDEGAMDDVVVVVVSVDNESVLSGRWLGMPLGSMREEVLTPSTELMRRGMVRAIVVTNFIAVVVRS